MGDSQWFDTLKPASCPECGKKTILIITKRGTSMSRVHEDTRLKACTPENNPTTTSQRHDQPTAP